MKNFLFFLFISLMVFSSCSENAEKAETTTAPEEATAATDSEAPTGTIADIKIGAFGATEAYPDAKLTSMDYKAGTFNFGVKDYELAVQTPDAKDLMCANSDEGQHIHLIIDNEPYLAKYEASFEQKMEDGEHTILAFLSRSYHESIKVPSASIVKNVTVKDGAFTATSDVKEPMLFYSRPKGTYVGDAAKKLLLDFYPYNVELGADYKVKVELNGQMIALLNKWQPYALEGLPMGDNKVTLTLVDGKGEMVETPLNPVSRTFTLKPDPTSELKSK